jgi:hypothetical protein
MAAVDDDQSGGSERSPRKRPPTHGNPDADPVRVHRRFVEQRLWSGNTERDDSASGDSGDEPPVADEASSDRASSDRASSAEAPDEEGVREQDPDDLARERYAHALDQWHRLPGSVSRPPTEVGDASAADEPTDADTDASDESSP